MQSSGGCGHDITLAEYKCADVKSEFSGLLFVVGMPRSGTKLLRDLLNRNPRVRVHLGVIKMSWCRLPGGWKPRLWVAKPAYAGFPRSYGGGGKPPSGGFAAHSPRLESPGGHLLNQF